MAFLVHLKIAYHDMERGSFVNNTDLKEARNIKEIILNEILASSAEVEENPGGINMFDLDTRVGKARPVPDGKFEIVQLDDNPT